MPRKPAKSYHHGDLRETLIRAGRAILEEEGPEALTLRACARRAGVSHAAPQHHFASLADLLAEIAATGFEDFVKALDEASSRAGSPAARLKAMCYSYIAFAERHPAVYKLMFGAKITNTSERLMKAMTLAWAQLEGGVKAVAGESELEARATHVWSLVHGFATLRLAQRLPPMVNASEALSLMIDGLPRAIAGADSRNQI